MEETEPAEDAFRPKTREELEADLAKLRRMELRTKYAKEARSHRNMKQRAKADGFEVDPRWQDFPTFLEDMGPAPDADASLDRVDTSLRVYGPGLVRWADKRTQTENRDKTIWVVLDGDDITLAELARRADKPYPTVYSAWRRGDTPEAIVGRARGGARFTGTRWRHPTPENEANLAASFEQWRKKLQPRFRSRYGYIDVYYLLRLADLFLDLDRHLNPENGDEVIDEDGRLGQDWHLYRTIPERMDYTLDCIRQRDPGLADDLDRRKGARMTDLAARLSTVLRREAEEGS